MGQIPERKANQSYLGTQIFWPSTALKANSIGVGKLFCHVLYLRHVHRRYGLFKVFTISLEAKSKAYLLY